MAKAKKAPAKGKPLKSRAIDTYLHLDPAPPNSSAPKPVPAKKAG